MSKVTNKKPEAVSHKKVPNESDHRELNHIIGMCITEISSWLSFRNASLAITKLQDAQDKIHRYMISDLKAPQNNKKVQDALKAANS